MAPAMAHAEYSNPRRNAERAFIFATIRSRSTSRRHAGGLTTRDGDCCVEAENRRLSLRRTEQGCD